MDGHHYHCWHLHVKMFWGAQITIKHYLLKRKKRSELGWELQCTRLQLRKGLQ